MLNFGSRRRSGPNLRPKNLLTRLSISVSVTGVSARCKIGGGILFLRIVTGIIGIIIAAFVIQTGGAVFACFAILLTLVGWHEYSNAFRQVGVMTTYIFGACTLILMLCCAWLRADARNTCDFFTDGFFERQRTTD